MGKKKTSRMHSGIGKTIKSIRSYRNFDQFEEDFFQRNTDEIEPYIQHIFDEYAGDGDSGSLLASLRVIARVKGISNIAEEANMTRQGLQKALSSRGNPRLDNVYAVLKAMGYRLIPEKIA
jgi:probable addiction module antidote protein